MTEKIRLSDYGFTILQLETRANCNMKCKFCAYPNRKDKTSTLPEEVCMKVIDSLDPSDEKLEYLCLSHYNEPLMDERIFRFITYAKQKNLKILLITNGLLFRTSEMREQLAATEPTYIKISFQTLNTDTFKARGIEYPFQEYKKNIYEFLKLTLDRNCKSQITIDIACNFLTKQKKWMKNTLGLECGDPSVADSIEEIKKDLFNMLNELKDFDSRFIFDEQKTNEILKNASVNYLDQTGLQIANNIKLKIKHFFYGRRLAKFYPVKSGKPCGTRILGIIADGTIVPCCLSYDDQLAIGNIKNEPLRSILEKSKPFLKTIKEVGGNKMPEICRICQGAPTKHGALVLDVIRKFKKE